jgi:hypothetical protein
LAGDYVGENHQQRALYKLLSNQLVPTLDIICRYSNQFYVVFINNLTDAMIQVLLQDFAPYSGLADNTRICGAGQGEEKAIQRGRAAPWVTPRCGLISLSTDKQPWCGHPRPLSLRFWSALSRIGESPASHASSTSAGRADDQTMPLPKQITRPWLRSNAR